MGTIYIEQWQETGDANSYGQPIYKGLVGITNDSTTTTSDETVTLDGRTNYVSITAIGTHRVAINSSTTGSLYLIVGSGERRDIAVPAEKGATIAYRSDT